MARRKNEYGLTPQQEEFCRAYVDAYGTDEYGILVAAYRKAYNCKNDARASSHYTKASLLMNEVKIRQRIKQLEDEMHSLTDIKKEQIIDRNAKILTTDPLRLMKQDPETGQYIAKRLNEIPKNLRQLVTPILVRGRMIYVLDKKTAQQVLINICGYDAPKDINVSNPGNILGELRIGFGNKEE